MNLHQIDFEETKRFSSIFIDYINNKKELQKYFSYSPEIKNFEKAISNRNFNDEKRPVLVNALKSQYKNNSLSPETAQNIELLNKNNTYTVTTGHQLNIFTGPLFFIYKIVATINMATILNKKYPLSHFVPVYWMATEDHDFEEINNFNLFGKKHAWETDQKGPVGRFKTHSIQEILKEIPELPELFTRGYLTNNTLSDATRYIVNELFGAHGLVILDADDKNLKSEFIPIIKDDVLNNSANACAQQTTSELEGLGYKSQIFPRPINFFYMEDGLRERIEEADGKFNVLNSSYSFTREEIEKQIEDHPEKFSPNVVLRPVYQEIILPNLAYVGGPAEVSYWLQLKGVFDNYQIPFPILYPRLFVMVITKAIAKKMNKLQLDGASTFKDFDALKTQILYSDSEPVHDLSNELSEIKKVFESIQQKAHKLDKSLDGFVMSEHKKTEKGVENVQKRLKRAEEQKEEISIKQLEGVLDKLFPGGSPQERVDNFLNFYINNPNFIKELMDKLDPFILKYNILSEDV